MRSIMHVVQSSRNELWLHFEIRCFIGNKVVNAGNLLYNFLKMINKLVNSVLNLWKHTVRFTQKNKRANGAFIAKL